MTIRGFFIAGTSTEVGKTHIGAMIARALVAAGQRVGVYKPVASGCRRENAELVADDALALWEAAGRPAPLERVCPQRFLAPLAPPLAAAAEGRCVDRQLLRSGLDFWTARCDIVLVEGAGGLMSPLSDQDYNVDLARDLGLPLLIVAANELGVINAALQTIVTAGVKAPRLSIAGVVLNQVGARAGDVSLTTNAGELAARCGVPLLAVVHRGESEFAAPIDWYDLASG